MGKLTTLGVLSIGIVFMAGCTQQAPTTNQNLNQPTANINQNVNQPTVNQPAANLNQNTNQQSATQPTNDTASWQTYTNEKYRFEVKYPESYSIFNTSGDSRISFRLTEACKSLVSGGGEWPTDCQAYDILVQQNGIGIAGGDTSKTFVAGIQAEKFTDSNGMWINGTQILVQFQKGQNWYIQTFTFNQGKSQIAEGVMNQILSTFKFTN